MESGEKIKPDVTKQPPALGRLESRRGFLKKAGLVGAGVIAAGGIGGLAKKMLGGGEQQTSEPTTAKAHGTETATPTKTTGSTETPKPTQTPQAQVTKTSEPTQTPSPTPSSSETAQPTESPSPTQRPETTQEINPLNPAYVENLHSLIDQINWSHYGIKQSADEIKMWLAESVSKKDEFELFDRLLDLSRKTEVNPLWFKRYERGKAFFTMEDESPAHRKLRKEAVEPLKEAMRIKYENNPATLERITRMFLEKPAFWDPENQKRYAFLLEMLPKIPDFHEEIFSDLLRLSLTLGRDLHWPETGDTGLINACVGYINNDDEFPEFNYIIDNMLKPFAVMVLEGKAKFAEEIIAAPREYTDYEKELATKILEECNKVRP